MAENKPNEMKLIYETQESLYQKALEKMGADRLIIQHAYKMENYLIAARMFDAVGEYLDAPKLAQRCRELAEKTGEEEKEYRYANAVRRMEDKPGYGKLVKLEAQFEALGDYKEAPLYLDQCRRMQAEKDKKVRRKRYTILGVLGAVVVACVAFYASGMFQYVKAVALDRAGSHSAAEDVFKTIPGFLNSDWYVRKIKYERVEHAKQDDVVEYGKYKWKILKKQASILTMIATDINSGHDFQRVAFDTEGDGTSWEDSSLRRWLNEEIYETAFDEVERSRILLQTSKVSVNDEYGTSFDAETQDYITLLSLEEIPEYQKTLDTLGLDYWLRTPGAQEGTVAFISAGRHNPMKYGYPAEDDILSVRPVIVVDTDGIDEEANRDAS